MNLKAIVPRKSPRQTGSALMLTMVMSGIGLAILAGAMTWSANSTRLTHRSIQHACSVAAAEAATEKVISRIAQDFLWGGENQVTENLAGYRQTVPTTLDSTFWEGWQFDDGNGNSGRTYVQLGIANKYVVLDSAYAGLRAFVSTYAVVSHARQDPALQEVVAGVLQEVQLARIPIFQFAMYSSSDMEISCGQPFNITGRVHSNGQLYIEPDNLMTFQSSVTAVGDILFQRHPLDTRGDPDGGVVYVQPDQKIAHVPAMVLPIGTNNTPLAIREIIQPPPAGEDPNSPIGRLRYYNQADLILVVTNTGITAISARHNNGAVIPIPANQLSQWVNTSNSFTDAREGKVVKPVDIDIGALAAWSKTSGNLNAALGGFDRLSSVYVLDKRTLSGTDLAAVRVRNGATLPTPGLTVATARPLYVLGDYNQMNPANLGTTNTATTRPASLVADAITILSPNWRDANSTKDVNLRLAKPATVNAAILTGVVETTLGKYSGGMENFPRFLETWGASNIFTYNGSMVKMFPSRYATNAWGKANVYSPPKRNWAYDTNFEDAAKLPPLTPGLQRVLRGRWTTVAANKNSAP